MDARRFLRDNAFWVGCGAVALTLGVATLVIERSKTPQEDVRSLHIETPAELGTDADYSKDGSVPVARRPPPPEGVPSPANRSSLSMIRGARPVGSKPGGLPAGADTPATPNAPESDKGLPKKDASGPGEPAPQGGVRGFLSNLFGGGAAAGGGGTGQGPAGESSPGLLGYFKGFFRGSSEGAGTQGVAGRGFLATVKNLFGLGSKPGPRPSGSRASGASAKALPPPPATQARTTGGARATGSSAVDSTSLAIGSGGDSKAPGGIASGTVSPDTTSGRVGSGTSHTGGGSGSSRREQERQQALAGCQRRCPQGTLDEQGNCDLSACRIRCERGGEQGTQCFARFDKTTGFCDRSHCRVDECNHRIGHHWEEATGQCLPNENYRLNQELCNKVVHGTWIESALPNGACLCNPPLVQQPANNPAGTECVNNPQAVQAETACVGSGGQWRLPQGGAQAECFCPHGKVLNAGTGRCEPAMGNCLVQAPSTPDPTDPTRCLIRCQGGGTCTAPAGGMLCETNPGIGISCTLDQGGSDCALSFSSGASPIRLGQRACFRVTYPTANLPTRWGGTDGGGACVACADDPGPKTNDTRCYDYPTSMPDLMGSYTRFLIILQGANEVCTTNTLSIQVTGPDNCRLSGPSSIRLGNQGCFSVSYAVAGLETRWDGTDKGGACTYCAQASGPQTPSGRACYDYPADQPDLVGTYTRRLEILHNGQPICRTNTLTIQVRPAP